MQTQPQALPTKTERSVADIDADTIEAFAKRLLSSGFVVAERGKDARAPTMQEAKLIAHAASKYDLDPLMGEVAVLGSKLYTTLAGVRKSARNIARKLGRRYCEATRPATTVEAAAANVAPNEHYWIADIIIDGGEESFRGHGFASNDNVAISAVWRDRQLIGHDPRIIRNMAENRAVRRALVAAFGLPFADPEDMAREDAPAVPATTAAAPSGRPADVYPPIPAAIESKPAPQQIVPQQQAPAQTAPQRQPRAPKPAAPAAQGPAQTAPPAPAHQQAGGTPPPISPTEAEQILRQEAAERQRQMEAERDARAEGWSSGD